MKPGIKTTEFWLSLLTGGALIGLATFLEAAGNHLGATASAVVSIIAPAIYAAGRARVKQNGSAT